MAKDYGFGGWGIVILIALFFLPETYKRNLKHGEGFDDGKGSY